jgi:hypothetical protein
MRPKGAASPGLEASIVRALVLGVNSERLAHIDLARVSQFEWWNWSVPEMEALFERHRDAVLALARGTVPAMGARCGRPGSRTRGRRGAVAGGRLMATRGV